MLIQLQNIQSYKGATNVNKTEISVFKRSSPSRRRKAWGHVFSQYLGCNCIPDVKFVI